MGYQRVKGWLLTIPSGLVIAAMIVIVVLQWGNTANFSAFGKNIYNANTALLMAISGAGGVVFVLLAWVLIRGLAALIKGGTQPSQEPKT